MKHTFRPLFLHLALAIGAVSASSCSKEEAVAPAPSATQSANFEETNVMQGPSELHWGQTANYRYHITSGHTYTWFIESEDPDNEFTLVQGATTNVWANAQVTAPSNYVYVRANLYLLQDGIIIASKTIQSSNTTVY